MEFLFSLLRVSFFGCLCHDGAGFTKRSSSAEAEASVNLFLILGMQSRGASESRYSVTLLVDLVEMWLRQALRH